VAERIVVALAGNPNSGKTTIFNNLTGARQHVGNYPGVTVEKKQGVRQHGALRMEIVDLPGTYSLTAYSIEEVVARDFLIDKRPDVVVDVADASNLERNLYLATQLIELQVPLVLALNMSDLAARRGFAIDAPRLSELLGARIVPTVGHKNRGTAELCNAVVARAQGRDVPEYVKVTYGREIEEEIARLIPLVEEHPQLTGHFRARWLAVKLLEDDSIVRERIERLAGADSRLLEAASASRRHIHTVFGDSPEIVIADRRYGFISGACQEAVVRTVEARHSMSDRIDAVVMHRVLGIPIFLLFTYLTFQFTFAFGAAPTDWVEALFGWLSEALASLWPKASPSVLRALLCDGVIAGVGGVLTFVPYIMLLFLAISFLEDSGYMARAAFIMDRLMHKIGLHGKSFIPMLIGFGCSVPAVMATRTLDTRRDRLTTMLVVPLMSCSARFVIYSVIVGAFFADKVLLDLGVLTLRLQPVMYMIIYLVGIVLAVVAAKLLRVTILRGETTPLVIELPPYRLPTVRGLLIHMWERAWLYIRKAGTVILALSIVLWVLTTYPRKQGLDRAFAPRRAAAAQAYVDGVQELAETLGIPDGGHALARLAQAEVDVVAARDRFHEHERGFREAAERRDTVLAELRKTLEGPRIERFLEFREAVASVLADFDRILADRRTVEQSPLLVAMAARRDQRLAELASRDPAACAAARAFHRRVHPAFLAELEAIRNEQAAERVAHSMAGRTGRAIEPALRPLGFDWKIGTAFIGAFVAKEAFVAQMGIVYAVGSGEANRDALRQHLRHDYSPLTGFCIMLFCLVSMPCMATVVMIRRESGHWGWAIFQLLGLTALAYVLTLLVYQLGSLLGIGT